MQVLELVLEFQFSINWKLLNKNGMIQQTTFLPITIIILPIITKPIPVLALKHLCP